MASSVFVRLNHLFGRNPRGGITDFGLMAQAGFGILLANIGDFAPEEWDEHRYGCEKVGMLCCPWLRTCGADDVFDEARLDRLLATADEWDTPLVVNSEKELDGSGATLTKLIRDRVGSRDAAVSMQSWPFDSVDWTQLDPLPVLPQLFNADSSNAANDPDGCVWKWHERGVRCVVPTFGTYGGQGPDDSLARLTPYGCYTADDMGQQYAPWSPEGTTERCYTIDDGGAMQPVGYQHGITAAVNRMRDLDPKGTLLVKSGGKWPPLDAIADVPLDSWKAYDKLERTLTILREDHDEQLGVVLSTEPTDSDADDE